MTKVLFFYNGILAMGGAERVLLEAASYFKTKGISVMVATPVLNKGVIRSYKRQYRVKIIGGTYFGRVRKLRSLIKKEDPDLIIGQSTTDCVYLYLATLFTNVPYISYVHGTLFWWDDDYLKYSLIHRRVFKEVRTSVAGHSEFCPEKFHGSMKWFFLKEFLAIFEYFSVRKAKALVVLTKQLAWETKKLYRRKSFVVRGCISESILDYRPKKDMRKRHGLQGKKIVYSVGRLDKRKRVDVLIEAFFNIATKRKDVYLLVGGSGPDRERLEKLVSDSEFKDRVIMLGFVSDEEYFDYMAACDVFAFPSWTTSGIPPYEALALQKKVVWTTEAEEPVLDDEHVFLSDPTVKDFTRAILKALDYVPSHDIDLSKQTWNCYFEKLRRISMQVIERIKITTNK